MAAAARRRREARSAPGSARGCGSPAWPRSCHRMPLHRGRSWRNRDSSSGSSCYDFGFAGRDFRVWDGSLGLLLRLRRGERRPQGNLQTFSIGPRTRTAGRAGRSWGPPSRPSGSAPARMKVLMPARWAARTFSFSPPTGSTRPRRVISPVMATSRRTGRPVSAEISAVAMVMPADGPSLGMAPAGHVDVDVQLSRNRAGRSPARRPAIAM